MPLKTNLSYFTKRFCYQNNLSAQGFTGWYLAVLSPCKFYGTGKLHKITPNDSVDQLPIRHIVSNSDGASYHESTYLVTILSLIKISQCKLDSTKEFLEKIRVETVPNLSWLPSGLLWLEVVVYQCSISKSYWPIVIRNIGSKINKYCSHKKRHGRTIFILDMESTFYF